MESTHIILSATVASAPFESTHLLLSSAATATTTLRSGFSYQAQTPVTTSTNLLLLPSFPYPTSSPSDVGADNNSSFSSQQRLSLPLLLGIAIGSGGVAVVCPICLIIAIRCMIKRKKRHSFTVTEEEEVCSNAHTHLPIVQNLLWEVRQKLVHENVSSVHDTAQCHLSV